jgi:hypothetical protein
MFGGAIDVPLPITTFSHSAMVDVIAQPVDSSSHVLISGRGEEAHRGECSAHEAGRTVRSPRFSGHEGV